MYEKEARVSTIDWIEIQETCVKANSKNSLKLTIPLNKAASLFWEFYRDPLRSLTLLSLNILSQNRKMVFSSSKEPSFLILDPMALK